MQMLEVWFIRVAHFVFKNEWI